MRLILLRSGDGKWDGCHEFRLQIVGVVVVRELVVDWEQVVRW